MNQELTNNPFNPLTPPKVFDEIKVSLASPERILSWSYGEIKKPENWEADGTLDVLTEPVNPPSKPRYDPLLDADGDGKNDEKYLPSDSPVD